jgi:hypothetical protein
VRARDVEGLLEDPAVVGAVEEALGAVDVADDLRVERPQEVVPVAAAPGTDHRCAAVRPRPER